MDTVVTVSSTGIATPSLEARAFSALGFRRDVRRVPVFGLGCAGGVTGLGLNTSLVIAVSIILIYTFLGGYLAVAYTGFLQAIIMVIGMLWILIATVQHVGGLTAGHRGVAEINENLLHMWGAEGQFFGQWAPLLVGGAASRAGRGHLSIRDSGRGGCVPRRISRRRPRPRRTPRARRS